MISNILRHLMFMAWLAAALPAWGNNRVVAQADGTTEQVSHYYPFGGLMAESQGGDIQRYKYNGKELDRLNGIDWYDYGARHYDGVRFTTVDPLAETDFPTSPYAYCGGNPMIRIDRDGRIWDTVLDAAFVAYDLAEAATQYIHTGSVSNTTKAALSADALAAVIPGITGAGLAVRSGAKTVERAISRECKVRNAKELSEGIIFEKAEFVATKASGQKVASHIRIVPQNGIGNVAKNRSTVDLLIQNNNYNYRIVETKLREKTSKLSAGQRRVRKNIIEGNKQFEVRSNNKDLGLKKGQLIQVDDYVIKYKYRK